MTKRKSIYINGVNKYRDYYIQLKVNTQNERGKSLRSPASYCLTQSFSTYRCCYRALL